MKLRLRSLESKETLKIEVSNPCSLQHLKEIITQRISSSSSLASVHLSLNRKDELLCLSHQDSLQSIGITSGDLIFFTLSHDGFSPETLIPVTNGNAQETESRQIQNLQPNSHKERTLNRTACFNSHKEDNIVLNSRKEDTLYLKTHNEETINSESLKADTHEVNTEKEETLGCNLGKNENKLQKGEILGLEGQGEENPGVYGTENIDVDDGGSILKGGKSFSVPCFLRNVFSKEVGEGGGGDHKLLVVAVHAILLDSGFVGFDSVSGMKFKGFHIPDDCPSSAFTISMRYTLPQITDQGNGIETVLLNFRSLGKYVNVYGSLAKNGSGTYWVCLAEDRLVFLLNIMWANCTSMNEMNGNDTFSRVNPEREVFDFWRTVKDRLALPLLIDLCERAGLDPPPSFMRLPTDLKLKIIEGLPGVDVAKVGCVSSELHYLSLNDDLWMQKFVELFGNVQESQRGTLWKEKFALSWETQKKRRIAISERLPRLRGGPYIFPPRIITDSGPHTLGVPRIIGGDYDIGPTFPPGWSVRSATRRRIIPHRDLGVRRV